MYETCPKCSYQRQAKDSSDPNSCPACGIVFSKWLKSQLSAARPVARLEEENSEPNGGVVAFISAWLFYNEEPTSPLVFWGRTALYIVLLVWGWSFIKMDFVLNPFQIGQSFMHNIDLIFHEAGHILFMPFGRFMTILGGSLFQVMMPLIVLFTFLIKNRNPFAASVALWWTGQSLMDLAPYIDDAIDQKLVLLGGRTGADAPGNHDWGNILIDLDMLEKHREIATFVDSSGTALMLLAFAWGGYMLYRQFGSLA